MPFTDSLTESCAAQSELTLREQILPRLPGLARCQSLAEVEDHPEYHPLRQQVNAVLECVEVDDLRRVEAPPKQQYRIVAWNIERGNQLDAQLEVLRHNAHLLDFDVLLLTEVDKGMARSGNRDVARDLARELGLFYAFVPCYLNLGKGSGLEREVAGKNELGLQGNAVFSRYSLSGVRHIPLPNGIDKMAGREKRLGQLNALAAEIHFPDFPVTAVAVHLDAQSSQRHRREQMRHVLAKVGEEIPCVLGGDWNTSTYNSSTAFRAIMGYWLRVIMGTDNVIRNHYMHPYRWFEKPLFGLLESQGFDYRSCNRIGEQTALYDMIGAKAHRILAEWIPGWCFPFIRWALRNHGGICPLKLDWFAARGVRCSTPAIIHDLQTPAGEALSDHDPIAVDIRRQ